VQAEHLDHALEQEFAGHAATIHRLKVSDPGFKAQNIQNGVAPASDDHLHALQKQRLNILDDVAKLIGDAES
jgi:uncharacterized protein YdcH (DUF465 family)